PHVQAAAGYEIQTAGTPIWTLDIAGKMALVSGSFSANSSVAAGFSGAIRITYDCSEVAQNKWRLQPSLYILCFQSRLASNERMCKPIRGRFVFLYCEAGALQSLSEVWLLKP